MKDQRPSKNHFHLILKLMSTWVYFCVLYLTLYSTILHSLFPNPFTQLVNATMAIEALSLFLLFAIVLVVSGKYWSSVIYTSLIYGVFIYLNNEKIRVFETILLPADLKYSYQAILAWDSFISYLPQIAMLTVFILLINFLVAKLNQKPIKVSSRLAVLVTLSILLSSTQVFQSEIKQAMQESRFKITGSHMLTFSKKKGLLNIFYLNLLFPNSVQKPADYSLDSMNSLIKKYSSNTIENKSEKQPHVIVFFIEAFTDPLNSGFETTRDPIPFFRKLAATHSSGHTLVPVVGGKSANSEFELLTGLSLRFIQKGSIPYIEYLNRPINSIVKAFNHLGYQSTALHVASLGFFNYKEAYPNLGFDQIATLKGRKGIGIDVANRFPDEQSLANEIIKVTKQGSQSKFIFAFPNSTHGFWNYPGYLDSDLDITSPSTINEKAAIKTYINALNTADQAIQTLVTHFNNQPEKTIILFVGDHYPGIRPYLGSNLSYKQNINGPIDFSNKPKNLSDYKFIKNEHPTTFFAAQHKVPYVIWTNFNAPIKNGDISMNLIHNKIFKLIDYQATPFFNLTQTLYEKMAEFSMVINYSGKYHLEAPTEYQTIIDDYKMFQYDILHGENYYEAWSTRQRKQQLKLAE